MKNDLLAYRHIGISEKDEEKMLQKIGVKSLDELIDKTIPANIRLKEPLALPKTMTEYEFGQHITGLAAKNKLYTTYIGMGWYNTITPAVIQRNVFENPVWYTSYTPYQTEVSQGRLEALMNFQTAVCDLTGMPLANCSLLDEATASLDPENEVLVQKAIARLVEGKTVIMIAHRLRTVVDADQILVLDNGRLVEHGTHDELMEKNGLYHKLFHIQQESLGWAV